MQNAYLRPHLSSELRYDGCSPSLIISAARRLRTGFLVLSSFGLEQIAAAGSAGFARGLQKLVCVILHRLLLPMSPRVSAELGALFQPPLDLDNPSGSSTFSGTLEAG